MGKKRSKKTNDDGTERLTTEELVIAQFWLKKWSAPTIALKLGISKRRVRNILNSPRVVGYIHKRLTTN